MTYANPKAAKLAVLIAKSVHRAEGGKVGWSDGRIDNEIADSTYADGRSKAMMGFVNPAHFVKSTVEGQIHENHMLGNPTKLNKAELARQSQTPFLNIASDDDGYRIADHEGRHRMAALHAAGVERAPVLLKFGRGEYRQPMDSLPLKAQFAGYKESNRPQLNVSDLTPMHSDYAGVIKQKMKGSDFKFAEGGEVSNPAEHPPPTPQGPYGACLEESKPEYKQSWYPYRAMGQYDPEFFNKEPEHLEDEAGKVVGSREKLVPKRHIQYEVPIEKRSDTIHRGMSHDEYENFRRTGEIKSQGSYNIGEEQHGLTYFTTDPLSAQSYANSFAPWDKVPTFDRPAYIVSAKHPGEEHVKHVSGTGEHEVGVTRPILAHEVTSIHRGRVIDYNPGEAGSLKPRASLHWERVEPREGRASGGEVNHNPTEAQKAAGNYKKEHIWFDGLNISIENKKGSTRSGVDANGKRWSCRLPADYGYVKGTMGADGDHVDVYLGPNRNSKQVFIINQRDHRSGKFDEHKAMLGFDSERDAVKCYRDAFSDGMGMARLGSIEPVSLDAFKRWLRTGQTTKIAKSPAIIQHALGLASRKLASAR